MASACRLKERVCATEDDSEALCVVRATFDELRAEGASMPAVTEPAKTERDTLPARVRELKVTAMTRNGELGVLVGAVRSLRGRVAAGEDRANTAEAWLARCYTIYPSFWHLSRGSVGTFVATVCAFQGSSVQSWHESGRSVMHPRQTMKAGSATQYVACMTDFLSRHLLMHLVRLLVVRLICLRSRSLYEISFCLTLVNFIDFYIIVSC